MKPFRSPLLIAAAFLLSACSSAVTPAAAPAPAPAPGVAASASDDAAPAPAPAPAPADAAPAPVTAPPHWWLTDADAASHGAGVAAAYREVLAGREPRRTVVVGVIDSGVDITHEDLDGSLWVNEDEVPGNGEDDDANGYADDVHGWNFIGGADGRNVADDSYEVTRLYAECQALPGEGGVVAGDVACAEIEPLFLERRKEAEQMLAQVRRMATGVAQVVTLLKGEVAGDSLTAKSVRAIVPMRSDVRQARQIYLQLAAAGITPTMIEEEEARLARLLERGLNPEFDPRPIVGDDYDDPTERRYGNPDVIGPDATHGTGVAGIIAAERGNGIGQDGIAASARIMVIRTVPDGDERDKDVANAIRYAVDNGAHVINLSFGKGYSPEKPVVDAAVRYAEEHDVLIVHAAGNEGDDLAETPSFPTPVYDDGGRAANWIEVGASNWQGTDALAAPFSNYGQAQVDVFAPGVDITTAAPDDAYQTNSGTSFAAPVVAGVAALIRAHYPELSAADVRRVILESARPYPSAMVALPGAPGERVAFGALSSTGGIVDARAALELAGEIAAGR